MSFFILTSNNRILSPIINSKDATIHNSISINMDNNNTGNQNDNLIFIPKLVIDIDNDEDGIKDLQDMINGARIEAVNETIYEDGYYNGGYPPEGIGVCTDVIWRAFKEAGYDLKSMVDEDIKDNPSDYPRVGGKPEPNIDFRRVKNLTPFFKKYAKNLTIKVKPNDKDNLTKWQGGDIVVFDSPNSHIAIISDKRNDEGIPYIIHNAPPYAKEEDMLLDWHNYYTPIIYHFRFPKVEKEKTYYE